MAGFSFQKIVTEDEKLTRVQTNIENTFNGIVGPFIGGRLLTGLSVLSASATSFNHGLTRAPQVWVITDQNTTTTVKRTAWDENSITLQSGADCTISIWVN